MIITKQQKQNLFKLSLAQVSETHAPKARKA
jgi:hypothetical protein